MTSTVDSRGITAEIARRADLLTALRSDLRLMAACRLHYAQHPADFISDFGVTVDPRLPAQGLPSMVPFRLFPRQRELVEWVMARYDAQEPGVIPKSRDMGASWVMMALACTLCIFRPGIHVGVGSRKEEYVDRLGAPKALFPRARQFLEHLPVEFRAGWTPAHAPHMRILFPETDSAITGEAGDNIGRGDRASLYIVDEAAFLERPQLIENSLSATTNCRIDLSSANGTDNPFAEKVHSWPDDRVFWLRWTDDPRKGPEWYAKQCELLPAETVAQEIDLNFSASRSGIIIPAEWVQSAIGAAERIGIRPTGEHLASLDVADEGIDLNAWAHRHGIELKALEAWSGKGSDLAATAARAFTLCDDAGVKRLRYDADGLGAGVRGDARLLNANRPGRPLDVEGWRASGSPVDPERPIETLHGAARRDPGERTNEDFFANAKAQAWHSLRLRFERTHRAVTASESFEPDALISISPDLKPDLLRKLTVELSQPTWTTNNVGKLVVNKTPDGTRSPNLADAVLMAYAPNAARRRSIFSTT